MNSMLLPLSCVSAGPCNDTSGTDYGVVITGIVAVAAIVAAILLARRGHGGWAVLLGLVFIGLGAAAILVPQPYGWFAYVPKSGEVFVSAPLGALAISGFIVSAAGLFSLGCGVASMIARQAIRAGVDARGTARPDS